MIQPSQHGHGILALLTYLVSEISPCSSFSVDSDKFAELLLRAPVWDYYKTERIAKFLPW
jgi:hypothetical protein